MENLKIINMNFLIQFLQIVRIYRVRAYLIQNSLNSDSEIPSFGNQSLIFK